MIAFALAVVAATGVASIMLLRLRLSGGWGLAGTAVFLGILATALWTHLLLFVAVPVTLITVLIGPLLLCGAAAWKGDRESLRVTWRHPGAWGIPILLSALMAVGGALSWHLLGYDGELFYSLKARSILHHGTIWNVDFLDPARIHMANRRPLLLPAIYADFHLLAGTMDHRMLRLWFAVFYLGALAVVHERARPHPAWLAVFAHLPVLWYDAHGGVNTGYADITFAVLLFVSFDALRKGERALATLSLVAMALLKQEGVMIPVALGVATLVTQPRELARCAAPLAAPLVVGGAWILLARQLPWSHDFGPEQFSAASLLASPSRWPLVAQRLTSEMLKPAHWGLFWPLAIGAVAWRARRLERIDVRWLLSAALPLCAYGAVLATYPDDQVVGATRVQRMRLVLHAVPLLWAWIAFRHGNKNAKRFCCFDGQSL